MKMTVYHQSEKNTKWPSVDELLSNNDEVAKVTLVLGSFNPFNDTGSNVDYYYGRTANYFWKIISRIMAKNEDDFYTDCNIDLENRLIRKKEALKNNFLCLDLIKSLDIIGEKEQDLNSFIKNDILKNFFDSKIFTTKHNKKNIIINRAYNTERIVKVIDSKKIKSVIHTLGGRINSHNITPIELRNEINIIRNACIKNDIEFILCSESPSQINVNRNHGGDVGNLVNHYRSLLDL